MQEGRCVELFEKYRIECEIGRGASGICYRVVDVKTRELFALKKIHVSAVKRQSTREACSQVQMLSKVSHPHIIKLYDSFADHSHVYILMQYAPKGDLHQLLKRRKIKGECYSEEEVWRMARQLLSALLHLHGRSIVHRDVKTLNIFVDESNLLHLGDLGVSKIIKPDAGLFSRVGTPLYLAPEIIKNEKYDFKADIWGLGCVCYQIASLTHPFEGKNIIALGQNIVASQQKYLEGFSPMLNAFLADLLEKNPAKRPSAQELMKKYFDESVSLTTMPSMQAKSDKISLSKGSTMIIENVNRISARGVFELKPSYLKRKVVNNYFQEKMKGKGEDKVKEEELKDSRQATQKLDETIILPKKQRLESCKKYVEVTRKSNPLARTENIHIFKQSTPVIAESKKRPTEIQSNPPFISFNSEKKFYPNIETKISNTHCLPREIQPSLQRVRLDQATRLPSQTTLLPSKSRLRPKSSIMTKQRHESTMKNMRKNFKKLQFQQLQIFVETQVLQRPQVIIL